MKGLFSVVFVSCLLFIGGGCTSEKKDTATAKACTKCACPGFTDANGDGKCDTMVACDHSAADHAAGKACSKCKCTGWTDANGDGKCDSKVACDHTAAEHAAK